MNLNFSADIFDGRKSYGSFSDSAATEAEAIEQAKAWARKVPAENAVLRVNIGGVIHSFPLKDL